MVPFFGWGIYTLRIRYQLHEELSHSMENITLVAIALFYMVEISLLGGWMDGSPTLLMFTILALIVSGMALYGPLLVAAAAQFFVNLILPPKRADPHSPHFAPAEALERVGDHEGALQEYLVMVRIFPQDATCALRVADSFMTLDRVAESTQWFERGLSNLTDPERSARVVNRLSTIYLNRLEQPDEAGRVIREFVDKYPEDERVAGMQERLKRFNTDEAEDEDTPVKSDELVAMGEGPGLQEADPGKKSALVALDTGPDLQEVETEDEDLLEPEAEEPMALEERPSVSSDLLALDEHHLGDDGGEDEEQPSAAGGLELIRPDEDETEEDGGL